VRGDAILNPGCLRHQITWQRKNVVGQDSYGGETLGTPAYLQVVNCRAEVTALQGRELSAAQQRWAEAKWQIKQHWYRGLTPDMRISWYIDGEVRTLDVLDIQDPAGTGRMQVITAKDHVE
jgi:head-tail adaptor